MIRSILIQPKTCKQSPLPAAGIPLTILGKLLEKSQKKLSCGVGVYVHFVSRKYSDKNRITCCWLVAGDTQLMLQRDSWSCQSFDVSDTQLRIIVGDHLHDSISIVTIHQQENTSGERHKPRAQTQDDN